MAAKITKIWSDVVEVTFVNEELPKIDTVLEIEDKKTTLLVKKINDENSLLAVIITSNNQISVNDKVKNTQKSFMVPVGSKAKGNIFDITGKNLVDEKQKVTLVEMNSTINVKKEYKIQNKILETGIKAIDFFIPIIEGSKIGIFGGAGVGKTVLMKEIIFNLSKQNDKTSSIFIGAGERSREGVELYQDLSESDLMKNSIMYIAKMNENAGARMNIVPIGITSAEYLRDVEKENVLLFIDNIYRYLQAGNEVSASMDKKPSIGGYQATLNSDIAAVEDRIFANDKGSITSFQTVFLPMDDFSDPSAVATFKHLDGTMFLSREIASKNIFPAFDPLLSNSASVNNKIISQRHYNAIVETKKVLQKYKELEDIILILGFDQLDKESKIIVKKAMQLQNFFSQTFAMAANFMQTKPQFVSLEKTIDSVERILSGEFLEINPEKFLYIADVSEII
ncbi:F0F1 ATP synthase subunit beta [[Mycoplasma] falconis]|uniref:F0F1 ATP synthase subunit beta n=1 Tax=[Mycoplasma] falconis TaxID=92403 RepID=A0A501X9S6_9BACT|nr:F0F1 ATP synthase subunit beta [[Mycoplasma] falconis]TPE57270.1 F0F1 ATP synthase subunit beta [[Mycoplasma] falconis]